MVKECEFVVTCPIFALFYSVLMDEFWITHYCRRGGEGCERRRLKIAGKKVPITLLPNGTHLESLEETL